MENRLRGFSVAMCVGQYMVHYRVYDIQCTMHSVQCTVYNIQCTIHIGIVGGNVSKLMI